MGRFRPQWKGSSKMERSPEMAELSAGAAMVAAAAEGLKKRRADAKKEKKRRLMLRRRLARDIVRIGPDKAHERYAKSILRMDLRKRAGLLKDCRECLGNFVVPRDQPKLPCPKCHPEPKV